ncbi:MAG: M23 family metallopeptidase [Bacteroidia bacterium]|nr:M23 family metallopeptidase [Bacteroidia bacterium]
MKNFALLIVFIFSLLFPQPKGAILEEASLEIAFYPTNQIYPYSLKGPGTPAELYSLLLQNIAIKNPRKESYQISSLELLAKKEGEILLRKGLLKEDLEAKAKVFAQYQELGYLDLYDFQFQTKNLLEGFKLSTDLELASNEALLITKQALVLDMEVDEVGIEISFSDSQGNKFSSFSSLKVEKYQSPNSYHFPLKGSWFVGGAPNLHSHHRWGIIQEFAYDFVQLGEGTQDHIGDGSKLEDYFCYGKAVMSIGKGKVVGVRDGDEESDENLRQANESIEAWTQRSMQRQQALLAKGFEGVLGNYVVIEHEGGEYSYYLHLQKNSIEVKVGDLLERGAQIGRVGHSGNSEAPHLHFHLANGADPANSRSLPIHFENIESWPEGAHADAIQYGHIIKSL